MSKKLLKSFREKREFPISQIIKIITLWSPEYKIPFSMLVAVKVSSVWEQVRPNLGEPCFLRILSDGRQLFLPALDSFDNLDGLSDLKGSGLPDFWV